MTRKQGKNRKQIVDHGKGSASKTGQSGHKRVALWFLGLVGVAITALVTATFTNLGNSALSFVGDLFSSAGSPVRIDSFRTMHYLGDSHAFANALVLSDTELSHLNSLNQTDPSYEAWFTSRHAVDTNSTTTQFVVEGSRNHTVRITDIQPIVSYQSPLKGTLFYSPPAGASTSLQLFFDLDNPHAAPSYIMENQAGKDFFGTHTVSLNKGEQFTFRVVSSTEKYFCKFTLTVTVLDENNTVTETITKNGQPFEVTAMLDNGYTTPGEFSAYQVLYIGGVVNPKNNYLWSRTNPNTYNSVTP